ncbi:hypothetical protein D3C81_1850190 [compost metagenome]
MFELCASAQRIEDVADHRAVDADVFLLIRLPRPDGEKHVANVDARRRSRDGFGGREIGHHGPAPRHPGIKSARQSKNGPARRQQTIRQGSPDNAAGADDECSMIHW